MGKRRSTPSGALPGPLLRDLGLGWVALLLLLALGLLPEALPTSWLLVLAPLLVAGFEALRRRRSRPLLRALEGLAERARGLEHGRLDRPIRVVGTAEIQALSGSLDRVRESLRDARNDLERREQELRRLHAVQTRFVANVSHEIRTPLTAILGFADMIDDEDLAPAARRRALETVRRNGRHLQAIVNDVLDLSKADSGRLELSLAPLNPRQLVEEVRRSLAPRTPAGGPALETEIDPEVPERVRSDATRLRQILLNLVSNALKFTEVGSVRIALRANPEGPGLEFSVSDTGRGIPDDQIERIFEPFAQADDSLTRDRGGTGLGLTICRQLTNLLGGRLEARNHEAGGAVFTLRLPCEVLPSSPRRTRPESAVPPETDRRPRVLLAEDSEDNRVLLTMLLRRLGADCRLVRDGRQAVRACLDAAASDEPFDLVLMDVQMPVMDGLEATRLLRESGATTTVVALTAHTADSYRERCLAAGCDDFLTKPIDREALAGMLETTMERRREPGDALAAPASPTPQTSEDLGSRLSYSSR